MRSPHAGPDAQTEIAGRVLAVLYDRPDGFVLVDELSRLTGLSPPRAAKAIDALVASGQTIERAPAHGVRLVRPAKLTAHLVERDLGASRIGRNAICFDEVGSTNQVALDSARQGDTDGLVVLAESQHSGRGRHGRTWLSPPGANLLFSTVLIEPEISTLSREALTIAAGLATAEGIDAACGLDARLKWPNDVLLDGRKAAGILVETSRMRGQTVLVVGVGVNVNACPPPDKIDSPAVSLAEQVGQPVERTEVVRGVLRRIDAWVRAVTDGDLAGLRDAWITRCGMMNERVTVLCEGRRHVGRVLDVSPLRGLVLGCDDGRTVDLPAHSSTIVK